jgi:hypothetical protein
MGLTGESPSKAAATCWRSGWQGPAVPHSGPWGKVVDNIASKLAFFPPQPSSYSVEEHKDGTGQLYIQPVDRWGCRLQRSALAKHQLGLTCY